MQLPLSFQHEPEPTTHPWTTLDESQRAAVLEALAKLIAQAAHETLNDGGHDDE